MIKKFKITIIILLVISIMYNFIGLNKLTKDKETKKLNIENVSINEKKELDKNMFAFMIQGDNGNYTQSQSNTWPGEEYKINTEKTGCIDTKGEKIENSIEYDSKTNKVVVIGNKTSYCYLYFDKLVGGSQILDNLPTDSGISAEKLGDMRRYQGTDVKNYICINDTGEKCNSGSNEMYRIIGIVEDGEEAGEIKVIKQTKFGMWEYKWNHVESSDCRGTTCSWPNSDLVSTVNYTFGNGLSTKVQEHIVSRQWYYGDISNDYADQDANIIYQIETGQINTQYYDVATRNLITNQKWQKTSESLKIGLMYIHDYYWQSTSTNCHYNRRVASYRNCLDNGWMHLAQNGNTSDSEWIMSRVGFFNSDDTKVRAWTVASEGFISNTYLTATYGFRPVFYLSSDVKIKEGTGEKTNPYILDLS